MNIKKVIAICFCVVCTLGLVACGEDDSSTAMNSVYEDQALKNIEKSRESKDLQMVDTVYSAFYTLLANEESYYKLVPKSGEKNYYISSANGKLKITTDSGNLDSSSYNELVNIIGSDNFELVSQKYANSKFKMVVNDYGILSFPEEVSGK